MSTKKDRVSSLKSYKRAVDKLIEILNTRIAKGDKESDLKQKLKSKKNAFTSAMKIIMLIHETESMYLSNIDLKWLTEKTEELCVAANDAALNMCSLIEGENPEEELGGSEINANIDMRESGAKDIKDIFDGIDELQGKVERAKKEQTWSDDIEDFTDSVVEEYAEDGE